MEMWHSLELSSADRYARAKSLKGICAYAALYRNDEDLSLKSMKHTSASTSKYCVSLCAEAWKVLLVAVCRASRLAFDSALNVVADIVIVDDGGLEMR